MLASPIISCQNNSKLVQKLLTKNAYKENYIQIFPEWVLFKFVRVVAPV